MVDGSVGARALSAVSGLLAGGALTFDGVTHPVCGLCAVAAALAGGGGAGGATELLARAVGWCAGAFGVTDRPSSAAGTAVSGVDGGVCLGCGLAQGA